MKMVASSEVAARVAETILRYNMLSSGHSVGVAVSGGADSVFLLALLAELAPARDWRLTVLHLNHGLRGEASDADEALVRRAAAAAGADCKVARATGLAGPNLEERARQARYDFFARAAVELALDRVATAHTLDDQAETFLLRLLRGAAGTGLAGIEPVSRDGAIVRPLLELERSEIEAWLRERGIAWREDASNLDPAFARNRIRHDLLPALERDWNPGLRKVLARTAGVLGGEEFYWRDWAGRELASLSRLGPGGGLILAVKPMLELPLAARRRLLRAAVERVRPAGLRQIDHDHIAKLERLCDAGRGSGAVRLPGMTALRSFGQLLLTRHLERAPLTEVVISQPGAVVVPGARGTLHFRVVTPPGDTGYNTGAGLGPGAIDPPVVVRGWRPGDIYQPEGDWRRRKLKDLFQECKVPSWERRSWPIIESDGRIVWARRFGMAAGFSPNWTCEDEMTTD